MHKIRFRRSRAAMVATAAVLLLSAAVITAAGATPTVDATITIPTNATCANQTTGPMKVAVSPDGTRTYVTLNGDGRLAQLNNATNTLIDWSCTGERYPEDVAVSPNGAYAYVTNSASSSLSVFDTTTMARIQTMNVPSASDGVDIVVSPDGTRGYVFRHREGSITMVNLTNYSFMTTIPVGNSTSRRAKGIAISSDGSTLYALVDAGVAVIPTSTYTVSSTIPFTNAGAVAISADGSFLLVVGGTNRDTIYRVRASDGIVTATYVGASGMTQIAITPDGTLAVAVNNSTNAALLIDAALLSLTNTVAVGDSPYGVAISPDGSTAWVADWGGGFGNQVTRIALNWTAPTSSSIVSSTSSSSVTTSSTTSTSVAPVLRSGDNSSTTVVDAVTTTIAAVDSGEPIAPAFTG